MPSGSDYRLPPGRPGLRPGPGNVESMPDMVRIAQQRRMETGDAFGNAGRSGSSISVGRVGIPNRSAVAPGRTTGTGMGVRGGFRFKEGGEVKKKPKKMAKGGSTASKRADGCATKGKTKGRFV
jgi:hypothetical protein